MTKKTRANTKGEWIPPQTAPCQEMAPCYRSEVTYTIPIKGQQLRENSMNYNQNILHIFAIYQVYLWL